MSFLAVDRSFDRFLANIQTVSGMLLKRKITFPPLTLIALEEFNRYIVGLLYLSARTLRPSTQPTPREKPHYYENERQQI